MNLNKLKGLGNKTMAFVVSALAVGTPAQSFADASTFTPEPIVQKAEQTQTTVKTRTAASDFPDIPSNHWGVGAINWGLVENVIAGYPNGTFQPDGSLSDAEFAVILARYASNTNKDEIKAPIDNGMHWSQNYYNGLDDFELPFRGYTNNVAKDADISRGVIAQIIAAKYGFNLTVEQSVYFMYENGLSKGMDDSLRTFDSYGANQSLTRAQAVQFLLNIDNIGLKQMTFKGKASIKGNVNDKREILGIVGVPLSTEKVDFADFGMMGPISSGIKTKVVNGKVVVEMNKITEPTVTVGNSSLKYMNYFDYDTTAKFTGGTMNNSIAKINGVELPRNKNFKSAKGLNDGGLINIELDGSEAAAGSFTDKVVFVSLLDNLSTFKASSGQITKAKEIVNTWHQKTNERNNSLIVVNSKNKDSSMLIYYGSGDVTIEMRTGYGSGNSLAATEFGDEIINLD